MSKSLLASAFSRCIAHWQWKHMILGRSPQDRLLPRGRTISATPDSAPENTSPAVVELKLIRKWLLSLFGLMSFRANRK